MAASTQDDDDGINAINVTPLVDIMLVLLVIFMVASAYIVKDAIEVELPQASTSSETTDLTLAIVLDQEGRLFLNGAPANEDAIAGACRDALTKNPNSQAIIAADDGVRHGQVIRLIDLVRSNGLTKFAINVKSPSNAE